jgi:hypothetical protein
MFTSLWKCNIFVPVLTCITWLFLKSLLWHSIMYWPSSLKAPCHPVTWSYTHYNSLFSFKMLSHENARPEGDSYLACLDSIEYGCVWCMWCMGFEEFDHLLDLADCVDSKVFLCTYANIGRGNALQAEDCAWLWLRQCAYTPLIAL